MKLADLACGLIALALLVLFLGKYLASIPSVPLWVIVLAVLVLPFADWVLTLRGKDDLES